MKTTLLIVAITLIFVSLVIVPQSTLLLLAVAPIAGTKPIKKNSNKSSLFGNETPINDKQSIDTLIERIKSFILQFIPMYLKANPTYESKTHETKKRKGIFATDLNPVIYKYFNMAGDKADLEFLKGITNDMVNDQKLYVIPMRHNVLFTLDKVESQATAKPELFKLTEAIKV